MANLKSCHGVSEIHLVHTPKRVQTGLYSVSMSLPKYVVESFDWKSHHVKFHFYRTKTSKKPFITGRFAHGTYDKSTDKYNMVVMKIEYVTNKICKLTNWTHRYGMASRFGIQDYSTHGFNDGSGMFLLHATKIKEAYEIINRRDTQYWHSANEFDSIEKMYAENIELFFQAARFIGLKRVYVSSHYIAITEPMPSFGDTFGTWLSRFTDLLGSRYSGSEGLRGGSGNSKILNFDNLHFLFPSEFYDKVYNVSTMKPLATDPEKLGIPARARGRLRAYNNITTRYETLSDQKKTIEVAMTKFNHKSVPTEAVVLYEEYLSLREKYLKCAGSYLYDNKYHIIETKWTNEYESMIFATYNYTSVCRIRLDERSNQVSGPWLYPLTDSPLLGVHCENKEIELHLQQLVSDSGETYESRFNALLEEVRYITMSVQTLAKLVG